VPDDDTLAKLESLGRLNCTQVEAGAFLGVSENTLREFLRQHEAAAEAFETGKAKGTLSLRRWQLKRAENGSDAMLIWLGKQLLKQTDKSNVEMDGKIVVSFSE
jgi:hypothetical protein